MDDNTARHFERRDPARNMRRFYRLWIARDLFGTVVLMRAWGRIGTAGRQRAEAQPDLAAARVAAERLARCKMRRGYVPVAWALTAVNTPPGAPKT